MTKQVDEDDLKQKLGAERYNILRKKGTEAPFTGTLLQNHDNGDYTCAVCGNVVFKSDTKFDSGSGWPSFYDPANTEAVKLVPDMSGGMSRMEVQCAVCGSHLGHVFDDAPDQPTGMRFCINSASLDFAKKA